MKVEVQFFSRLRDIAGGSNLDVDLPDGETLGGVLRRLYADLPDLRRWDAHLLMAVGLNYADRSQVLHEGDVVSIMPPVQGG